MHTRTLQGARNSGANFQSRAEPCFHEMMHVHKAWIDDFVIHAASEQELFQELRNFLKNCREKNLKVSLPKSTFFAKELKWCGRIIDGEGVSLHPRRPLGLANVSKPEAELCKFVHCVTWMSTAIPDFTERIAQLRELLEEAQKLSGSRKKNSIKKYSETALGWGHKHTSEATPTVRKAVTP